MKYWKGILLGILGLFIGYKLNQYANRESEKRIIDAINAKIDLLKK